ncbi:MAG: AAA family ATPase [Chromatiales bacterium]|nr:AAA family ATPase [Chromatiales bacterium]
MSRIAGWERAGLERDPFPTTTDGLRVPIDGIDRELDLLHHLVQFGEQVMVVTGPAGAGKTAFVEALLEGATDHWRVCRLDGKALDDPDLVAQRIAEGFELPGLRAADAEPLRLLEDGLADLRGGGLVALLVVDDADQAEELTRRRLIGLERRLRSRGLRVVLTATRDARGRPAGLDELPPERTHVVDLRPLTEEETDRYLRARLEHAGLRGDSPLTPGVVRSLHRAADGRPGALHTLAARVLDNLPHQPPPRTAAPTRLRMPTIALGPRGSRALTVALAVAVAALGAWLVRPSPEPEAPAEPPLAPPTVATAPSPTEPARVEPAAPSASAAAEPTSTGQPPAMATTPSEPPPQPVVAEVVEAARPEPPPAEPAAEVGPTERASEAEPAPPTGTPERPATAEATATEPPSPPGAIAPPARLAALVPAPTLAALSTSPKAAGEPPAVRSPPPAPRPATTARATPSKGPRWRDVTWLASRPAGAYTLQIMGSEDASAARRFLASNPIDGDVVWVETVREGRPWFVLVHGLYRSADQAREAARRLPAAVRASGPWPRSVAEVVRGAAPPR